jgi:hypothetical protein
MKVYCVFGGSRYEGQWLCCIFTTKELAEDYRKHNGYGDLYTEEWDLEDAFKPHQNCQCIFCRSDREKARQSVSNPTQE